jgi:O-antigen/teichoic acid export membrane protein
MSVRKRIFAALAANVFGQLVTTGSQFLLTPLYFAQWGAAMYGEWLILSSIPAYLTMADLGIGSAAGNEMTMRAGAADHVGAQQTFRGALWVAGLASLVVGLIGVGAAALAWKANIPHTPHIDATMAAQILLVLSAAVAVSFFGGVVSAGFRCCGRNALGITLSNLSRLAEALVTAALLWANQSPLVLCASAFGIKLTMLLGQWVYLRVVCPWLFTPYSPADRTLVKRLIKPSLGFLAFPMGNALALQGPILVLGALFGGAPVAVFSAMRTLSRLPLQITNAFNSSVWPEMSRAYGAADMNALRQLHRRSWAATVFLILLTGSGMALLGPWIAHLWLSKSNVFNGPIFYTLIIVTMVSAIWNSNSVVLAATNSHARLGLQYVLANAVCLGMGAMVAKYMGIDGLLACLVLAEVVLLILVAPQAIAKTQDTLPAFLRHTLRMPFQSRPST